MSSESISEEQWKQIKDALRGGSKIEAIKLYREATNCQLAEAKQAVDTLHDELRAAEPENIRKAKGCFGIIALTLVCVYWIL